MAIKKEEIISACCRARA